MRTTTYSIGTATTMLLLLFFFFFTIRLDTITIMDMRLGEREYEVGWVGLGWVSAQEGQIESS
ncbi:hypothetical protein LguiB_026772 [Lonicera macranthoides]